MARFTHYTKSFAYGNQDTSGDPGEDNGLMKCWLSSSLRISPREQLDFLNRFVEGNLPVSPHAHEMTKKILHQEDFSDGWKLYGKTGSGVELDAQGHKIQDRKVGWFVGFAQKGDEIITFVYLIIDQELHVSSRAKSALKARLTKLCSARL